MDRNFGNKGSYMVNIVKSMRRSIYVYMEHDNKKDNPSGNIEQIKSRIENNVRCVHGGFSVLS